MFHVTQKEKQKEPYDPKYMRASEYRSAGRAVRPKDAATLILVRRDDDGPRVLLGQRHESHKFMPGKFVFPGGRVDAGDGRIAPQKDLHPAVATRLAQGCSPYRARALAMAAIRETFEEVGLLVGEPLQTPISTKSPHWRPFIEQGIAPALDKLHLVARAITPPYRSRRFDARFFMADAEQIQGDMHDTTNASGELLDLFWFTMAEARELELPNITRMVLGEVERRTTGNFDFAEPGPFIHFNNGKPIQDRV